jgi:hypothetical protein
MRRNIRSKSSAARVDKTGPPSGLKQTLKAFSYLLMSEVFATLKSGFAKLDGLNKTGLILKIPADGLLRERICVTPSLCSKVCKLMLSLRREMYFHACQCKCGRTRRQPPAGGLEEP